MIRAELCLGSFEWIWFGSGSKSARSCFHKRELVFSQAVGSSPGRGISEHEFEILLDFIYLVNKLL